MAETSITDPLALLSKIPSWYPMGKKGLPSSQTKLADHWDIAHWVIRLMFIGACLFTGMLAIWVYIGAWILMAPRSSRRTEGGDNVDDYVRHTDEDVEMEYDERRHDYRPKKVFRYSDSGSVRLKRARERLDAALRRVEGMESYVTSRQYNLNNEFSKL